MSVAISRGLRMSFTFSAVAGGTPCAASFKTVCVRLNTS
jgi:hypothetical protein